MQKVIKKKKKKEIPQPENEKEEGNIPYSCIPQLEKNDKSYFWDCYA